MDVLASLESRPRKVRPTAEEIDVAQIQRA